MTLLISLFHALDPRIDLALAKPQLGAHTEPMRPTPLAPEILDHLNGNLQLGGKLSQRDVVAESRL